jgi:hypothetical protein
MDPVYVLCNGFGEQGTSVCIACVLSWWGNGGGNMWQAVVNNLDDAHEQIDTAISTALKESKPAYISISCNLPGIPHPTFARDPVPFFLAPK